MSSWLRHLLLSHPHPNASCRLHMHECVQVNWWDEVFVYAQVCTCNCFTFFYISYFRQDTSATILTIRPACTTKLLTGTPTELLTEPPSYQATNWYIGFQLRYQQSLSTKVLTGLLTPSWPWSILYLRADLGKYTPDILVHLQSLQLGTATTHWALPRSPLTVHLKVGLQVKALWMSVCVTMWIS